MMNSLQQMAEQCEKEEIAFWEMVLQNDMSDRLVSREASMQQMQQILQNQSESMQATQNIVEEVLSGIGESMQGIGQIKSSTQRLDGSRSEVVEAVSALSELAGNNMEGTKKTYNETEAVAGTFKQVYESAEQLRQIAEQLVQSIDYFKM